MFKKLLSCSASLVVCFVAVSATAQNRAPRLEMPKNGTRATVVRVANLYVQADEASDRVAQITPGREMVVAERSSQWVRVFANTDAPDTRQSDVPVFGNDAETAVPISGWMLDKGIIRADTPKGDQILFGEAISAEQVAAEPHAPQRAAMDARLLYRRLAEMFPQSPWAGQAMWRAADIKWQLQKEDASTLPSAHEKESYLRQQMDEDEMKKIEKYFPHTKWSDLATYDKIDNKLCGDWQGSEKCPEKETDFYLKYVEEHPDSPKAPEALYKAAWRQAAAGDMWAADGNGKKADEDRGHARAIVQRLQEKYSQSEYAARGAGLIYKVEQGIPIYGSDRD